MESLFHGLCGLCKLLAMKTGKVRPQVGYSMLQMFEMPFVLLPKATHNETAKQGEKTEVFISCKQGTVLSRTWNKPPWLIMIKNEGTFANNFLHT